MSYFAQIRILDEDGENVARVNAQGGVAIEIAEISEVLVELKKMNAYLSILIGEEINEEDLA